MWFAKISLRAFHARIIVQQLRGVSTQTHQPVAVKIVHVSVLLADALDIYASGLAIASCYSVGDQAELDVLKQLRHPNIVRVFDIDTLDDYVTVVMELTTGGDLIERLNEYGPMHEKEASVYVGMILHGLAYLHRQGVVHGRINARALLFYNPGTNTKIMITDFGLTSLSPMSKEFIHSALCKEPEFISPEVIAGGNVSPASDIWSVGVVAYVMLCGFLPFEADTRTQLLRLILLGKVQFPSTEWDDVSDVGKEFIVSLMRSDARNRPSASTALRDDWIALHERIM